MMGMFALTSVIDAIRHGTIHIPPKDVITHLSFSNDQGVEGRKQARGLT
jgi:hypothetical protein